MLRLGQSALAWVLHRSETPAKGASTGVAAGSDPKHHKEA
jgi:hypothetical protein